MNERGLGNVEFILAFILFIGFVGTAIYLFNPVKSTSLIESSLEYTFDKIAKEASTEVNSYSVILKNKDIQAIQIPNIPNKKISVMQYSRIPLNSRRDLDGTIYFEGDLEKNFVIVYLNDEFVEEGSDVICSNGMSSCPFDQSNYQIASNYNNSVISRKKLLEDIAVKFDTSANYENLKTELNIPKGLDFSVKLKLSAKNNAGNGVEDINTEERGIKLKPRVNSEVFSKTEIREVLNISGGFEFGYLTVSVW